MRHPCTNSATGAACWQTAMWRLRKWTDFSRSSYRGTPGLDRREIVGKRPLLLSNLTGSELPSPQRMEPLLATVWSALAVEMCRIVGMLAAVLTLVMFEAYLRPREMLSLRPPGTDGDTVVPSDRYREKQNWRGGRHDQSRLKTMSMDVAGVREASATTATGRAINLNCAEYLSLFRRAANLQMEMVPCQGRRSGASADRAEYLRTLESRQNRGRWKSAKSVRRDEKGGRVNQSWSELAPLVQAHCEHCNNLLPSVLLPGNASSRHRLDCFVFCDRSLQRKHRFATALLEQRFSVRKPRSFF